VEAGSVVGLAFDPMLAKVIAHGPTRREATGRLALALERLHIGGVTTNAAFLAACLRDPAFAAGDTTTDFIEGVAPSASPALDDGALERLAVAAALWVQGRNRADAPVLGGIPSGWRNARLPAQQVAFTLGDRGVDVRYQWRRDGDFGVQVATSSAAADDDRSTDPHLEVMATVHRWAPDLIEVEIDGHRSTIQITAADDRLHVQAPGGTVDLAVVPRFPPPDHAGPVGGLVAPMPGVASEVRVAVGDRVTAGRVLVVLEAMKMEHHITAPVDGTVTELLVQAGGQVHNGQLLLVIEPADGDDGSTPAAAS
jgi:propionyl-CoA carboxylase alpha chain